MCNKEEPHTNINLKDLATESAELNVCIDSSLYVHAQLAEHMHKANGKFLA